MSLITRLSYLNAWLYHDRLVACEQTIPTVKYDLYLLMFIVYLKPNGDEEAEDSNVMLD